jgi:hypothetical protein
MSTRLRSCDGRRRSDEGAAGTRTRPGAIRVDGINLGAETCYPVAVVPITAPDIKDTLASTRIEPIDHSIAFICAPKVQRPHKVGEMPYEAGHR